MKYRYDTYRGLTKIKTKLFYGVAGLGLALGGTGLSLAAFGAAHAVANCTPTGFMRDGINLTAAQIGGNVNGTLDATGCNIGVYYDKQHSGNVRQAEIFGANYFGVVVDGSGGNVSVNVVQSSVHDIGESPLNGDQHGVAIYYNTCSSQNTCNATSGHVTGKVSQDKVYNYQKGGIVINGPKSNVPVSQNTVTGQGPVDYIAQNGIQISRGASGDVRQNTVTGNAYSGTNDASSAGILIYGGCGDPLVKNVMVSFNTATNNDVGVYVADYNNACTKGPAAATDINVAHNIISDDAVTNVSGNGYPQGYQAGVSDAGNSDKITFNAISGAGYAPQNTATAVVFPIDVSAPYSISPTLSHNTYDGNPYP